MSSLKKLVLLLEIKDPKEVFEQKDGRLKRDIFRREDKQKSVLIFYW